MRHAVVLALVVALLAACAGSDPGVDTSLARVATPTSSDQATPTTAAPTTTVVGTPAPELPGDDDPVPARAASAPRETSSRSAARRAAEPTGHLDIPAIGLSHATYEGIEMSTIDRGPSHWPGTAHPGQRGNTVFPGHRTTHSRPFWDIDRLQPGDELVFTTASGRFTYRVRETFVVGSRETWIVEPTEDATFTIFACHPKGSARQRYVVKGDLVAASPSTRSPTSTTTSTTTTPTTTTTTSPPRDGLVPDLPG